MHPTQIEVILDCTGFREVNEVPPATLQLLVLTFKTLYTSQLDTIFIFSPSSSFVFYFRKLLSVLPSECYVAVVHKRDSEHHLYFS